jgi:hypothetical protein
MRTNEFIVIIQEKPVMVAIVRKEWHRSTEERGLKQATFSEAVSRTLLNRKH